LTGFPNDSVPPDWKPELEAIVGSRHGGRIEGAVAQLESLANRFPNVAEIHAQLAWTLDVLGRPGEALPHYEKSVALGLAPNELAGALIGLGMTHRAMGEPDRAVAVLRSARAQFPDNREIDAFLALALHSAGENREAINLLVDALCDTTDDPGINAYQRALRHAARTP
jgi:Flp pilus assembly protein TadD